MCSVPDPVDRSMRLRSPERARILLELEPRRNPVSDRIALMTRIALVAILLLPGFPLEAQEQRPPAADVAAVIEAFHAALAAGDSTAALGLLDDDVTILESGNVEDKSHYRAGHLAGDMRFSQAIPRQGGEPTVTVRGDVAWAHSVSVREGQLGDRAINSQSAELMVLVREAGAWRIRAIHWSSRSRR